MTRLSAGPAAVEQGLPVVVRALRSTEDYVACVRLQRETWGEEFADYVPASLLKVGQLVGGVTVGAFTAEGRLVGFVFGLTGVREGRLTHWSHMLAVQAEFRNHGLGRRLKEYQRELLQGQGIETIYWTFDPLVARNAHLNLNRLGAQIREYVPDMYGDTGSPLHALGTDRLVVAWSVTPEEPARIGAPASRRWREAQVVGVDASGRELVQRSGNGAGRTDAPLFRIEIPAEIEAVPMPEALAWRETTRAAFVRLLAEGYHVAGFFMDDYRRCFYVLAAAETGLDG